MKQKIDNDKMWGFLFNALKEWESPITRTDIDNALYNQGLQYNAETNEIESIEQPSECKLVEAVVNEPVEQRPKFKVGDWVVDKQGLCHQIERVIENVTNHTYGYDIVGGGYFNSETEVHLWTIADAKDGDVLCTYEAEEPKIVFIVKGDVPRNCVCGYYCYYNMMYPHFSTDAEKGCLAPEEEDLRMTTKEQRDTLFKAMHYAGYMWDSTNKKLLSLKAEPEQNPCDECSLYCNGAEPTCPDYQEYLKDTEPEHEFSNPEVTKENEQELTEFEKELANLVGHHYVCKSDPDTDFTDAEFAKEYSEELLSIARKQIISEIDIDAMVKEWIDINKVHDAGPFAACFRMGVVAAVGKIKKGHDYDALIEEAYKVWLRMHFGF